MRKPDFRSLRELAKAVSETDAAFQGIYNDKDMQENNIRTLCGRIAGQEARKALSALSSDELKNARAGIRAQALIDAGYENLGQIAAATDVELQAVEGIGEKQIEAIRNIVTEFANSLSARVTIRLDASDPDKTSDNIALITELTNYINSEKIRRDALEAAKNLGDFATRVAESGMIRNGFRWFFSSAASKQNTLAIEEELHAFCGSAFFDRLMRLIDAYQAASHTSEEAAVEQFRANGAEYYAILENLGSAAGNRAFIYDSIPAQLAEEISATEVDLSGFSGTLRAYQLFGAKYILHQKKVLLGDEMGLGKTIQAIAVMSHLHTVSGGKGHFLVVCPASVLVNWARELHKFSRINTFIVHGQTADDALTKWQEQGGAAVTNYETLGRIVDRIDGRMKLFLLVIDEAHYMKNPDAQRTKYIRRLDNESERILLMTGTPLENRVSEMMSLIDYVRPDMADEVRSLAFISRLPEFREALAPVYLRRTREQVLKELPPISDEQEWCSLTPADLAAYAPAVLRGSFADMRRVSFLQDDLANSSKCIRMLELLEQAADDGRKVIVYSFFRETVAKVSQLLGDRCIGVITGDTDIGSRQLLVDRLGTAPGGSVLVSQIVAGGVGLNIQSASIVIFCEPQIKPSLESQALSRVYRMGQVQSVQVYHLLCPHTLDEEMISILEEKQVEFDNFADESVVAGAYDNIMDREWVRSVVEREREKYLPVVV